MAPSESETRSYATNDPSTQDEAQALAKAHAEAAAKEKAAAEKRKAEEEKVCSSVQSDGPFTSVVRARVTGLYAGAEESRRRGEEARRGHRESRS